MVAGWLSLVGAVVFIERSIYAEMPVVSLAPLANRTFVIACLLNFVIGFGLYAATYLMPVYLGLVRGYSSLDIGTTVFVRRAFMFLVRSRCCASIGIQVIHHERSLPQDSVCLLWACGC